MPICICRRLSGILIAGTALLVTVLLAACGETGLPSRGQGQGGAVTVDEVGAHDGQVCPVRLPENPKDGHGLGTQEPAGSSPSLPRLESAWICRYDPMEGGPMPDGEGTWTAWQRDGGVRPVSSSDTATLDRHLSKLEPADRARACHDDLGSRWLLVYASQDDLTGVVVDDFGCRDVRLTDEPFETPPGQATQPGTVSGVLVAPRGLLDDLRSAWRG